jgi:hypothetical protein
MTQESLVQPSLELLSEMESLEIHGGIGSAATGTDDVTNMYCSGAYCVKCQCIDIPTKTLADCAIVQYMYCGQGTTCD